MGEKVVRGEAEGLYMHLLDFGQEWKQLSRNLPVMQVEFALHI